MPDSRGQSTAVSVFVLFLSIAVVTGVFAVYLSGTETAEEPQSTLTSSWDGNGLTVNVVVAGNVDRLTVTGFDDTSAVRKGRWTTMGVDGLELVDGDIGPGASFRVEPGDPIGFGEPLVVRGHVGEQARVLYVFEVSD